MDNYETIAAKLKTLTPFRGNSMTGVFDEWGSFKVYSYSTQIAQAFPTSSGISRKMSTEKYSVTTSRHQNIIRRAWGL